MRLIIIIALFLTGCSTLPSAEKVSAFGDATSSTTSLFKNAVSSNRTIGTKIGEEDEARQYICGSAARQRSRDAARTPLCDGAGSPFSLADKASGALSKERLAVRLTALSALEEYGTALKLAADQGVIDGLQASAEKLGVAAGNFVSVLTPMYAPIVAPVFKITSRVAGYLLGNAYAGEIQAIINSQEPTIQQLLPLLKADLSDVAILLDAQLTVYRLRRATTLNIIRQDPAVDSLRLYKEYLAARKDVSDLEALAVAVKRYGPVLDALGEAHTALANNSPDVKQAIQKFAALAQDVAALAEAMKG